MAKKVDKIFKEDLESEFGIAGNWLKPLQDNFDNIKARMQWYVDDNTRLRKENKELKDEHYKDKELKRINKELEEVKQDLHRGFPIYEDEYKEIEKWRKAHTEKMHPNLPEKPVKYWAEGPDFNYMFSPFELGIVKKCYCENCRRKAQKEAKGDLEKYKELLKKYDVEFDFTGW